MVKFKRGQIIFLNWDGLFAKVVRYYNQVKYKEEGFSHVGIITNMTLSKVQIHEAGSNGFVKGWYSKEFLENMIKRETCAIVDSKVRTTNLEWEADKYLGRPYAWHDIFGIALSFLFGWRFLEITGAKKVICSEAVARILYDVSNKKINFELEYDKPYDLITPMDIYYSEQFDA